MSDFKAEEEDTSSVSSGLSLKSERSMGKPINFSNEPGPSDTKLEKMSDFKAEEEDTSSVSSGLSLKSERSMGKPINFSNEPGPSDTKQRAESTVSMCSLKSDWSKEWTPPDFSNEPGPSDTK
ncbi:hypothetical protein OYC64_007174 [Pagothenia borchgrevinki]|uniref:Uncharacterized protein n=1 Tax=Pagothenia borchgrevinki TaxID=8213 RepID=A0ABD2G4R3_PAGBO